MKNEIQIPNKPRNKQWLAALIPHLLRMSDTAGIQDTILEHEAERLIDALYNKKDQPITGWVLTITEHRNGGATFKLYHEWSHHEENLRAMSKV